VRRKDICHVSKRFLRGLLIVLAPAPAQVGGGVRGGDPPRGGDAGGGGGVGVGVWGGGADDANVATVRTPRFCISVS